MAESVPSKSDRAEESKAARLHLADLWTRVQEFCRERGWNAQLYVRDDRDQFGRVGVRIDQGGGYSCSAWGNTSNEAIQRIALTLGRDGFDG